MPVDRHILHEECSPEVPPLCERCGYDLRGLRHNRCPECGHVTPVSVLDEQSGQIKDALLELQDVNSRLRTGLYTGLIGSGVVTLLGIIGFAGLGMVLGLLSGLATLGMGLQVFRSLRLPEPARLSLGQSLRYVEGGMVALFGAALVVYALVLVPRWGS